ncbi:muts domain V-domain-containing protein [Entophlyctis helioformis]|nr:muts domain V-domain-containing protein [Entophlyctis helioformis]
MHSPASTPSSASKRPRKSADSLTPLEQQFADIKAANPDTLLFVEVGYKFRFFGDDAKIAGRELGIVAFMDHSMMTASIPVHRLEVHVKKLVQLGHKVGVVRQVETAALKASGSNKSAPFERKLTNVYTKGTMVFDMEACGDDAVMEGDSDTGYLVAIHEYKTTETGDCRIAFLAVHLATASIVYDDFVDNFLRTELETRLSHVEPAEMLLPKQDQSLQTQKIVGIASARLGRAQEAVRVERRDGFERKPEAAKQALAEEQTDGKLPQWTLADALWRATDLPLALFPCLLVIKEYLDDFGLANLFALETSAAPFGQIGHMSLSANTLASLEVFRNQTDGSTQGSLFEVLNATKTKFGRRLLRQWLARPLIQLEKLQERLEAVREISSLVSEQNETVLRMRSVVHQLPDIEKGLSRIFFGRSSPKEVFRLLTALCRVASALPSPSIDTRIQSPLVRTLLATPITILAIVQQLLGEISADGAEQNDKIMFFSQTDKYPDILMHAQSKRDVEAELMDQLADIRRVLKMPSLEYTAVSGIDYLIEVTNAKAAKVPPAWVKMSTTKAVSRFHTPEVTRLIQRRNCALEEISASCNAAFRLFMHEISSHFESFRRVIQAVATLDCLFSLSVTASNPAYSMPQMVAETTLHASDSFNPILQRLCGGQYVPNDISLDSHQRCLVITGPNMGGKSSYVRQVALLALMAQTGSFVPARHARVGVFDSIHVRMGASDDIARNQSTFMKELQDTSTILARSTCRSLVILDELGRGTSTFDGTAIAYATLRYLVEETRCLTLFVTHYPALGSVKDEVEAGVVRNAHMGFMRTGRSTMATAATADDEIVFLHKLADGVSRNSYGLNVARLAHVPQAVLAAAAQKSRQMEMAMEQRMAQVRRNETLRLFAALARPDCDADAVTAALAELHSKSSWLLDSEP